MGLFDKMFKKSESETIIVSDSDIVSIADGVMFDITTVSDPMFAEKMMGDGVAFKFTSDKVTLCAPTNGELSVLFPTGHAYGMTAANGVEIMVHCGIDTVEANGDGFKLLKVKQGDTVKAGTPIIEVNVKKLSQKYDMSTMLIITNPNGHDITFKDYGSYQKGQSIIK